jgi:hypothetical protein
MQPRCWAELVGALHGIGDVVGALHNDGAAACAVVGEEGDLEALGGAVGGDTVEVFVKEELLGAGHCVGRGRVEESCQ